MGDRAGWKDWVDGPLGHSLRGATYGGLLGWLYDKIRDKNGNGGDSVKRMATGALLGALSGSAMSNYLHSREGAKSEVLEKVTQERNAGNKP